MNGQITNLKNIDQAYYQKSANLYLMIPVIALIVFLCMMLLTGSGVIY